MNTNKPQQKTTKHECGDCNAFCCHNLAMEIGRPENRKEVEDLKWQLHFDTVKVYIHNRRWYQWVKGKCMYLGSDNRCTIYETRPEKCRKHNPPDCEHFGPYYDTLIETPDELEMYITAKKKFKRLHKKTSK